jgi:hypothetical protein
MVLPSLLVPHCTFPFGSCQKHSSRGDHSRVQKVQTAISIILGEDRLVAWTNRQHIYPLHTAQKGSLHIKQTKSRGLNHPSEGAVTGQMTRASLTARWLLIRQYLLLSCFWHPELFTWFKMIPPTSPGDPPNPPHPRSLRSASVVASRPSAQQISEEIVYRIPEIRECTEIIYRDINSDDGSLICRSLVNDERVERRATRYDIHAFTNTPTLDLCYNILRANFNAHTGLLRIKVMPTDIHEAHQRWAIDAVGE